MGDTAPTGEAAAWPAFAHLLAEAEAGKPEAEALLDARLRPVLEAMWQRHTSAPVMSEAGALVRALTLEAADAVAGAPATAETPKGAKGGRKGNRKRGKSAKADGPAPENAPPARLLTESGADLAALAMEGLVHEQLMRLEPEGTAVQTLQALRALEAFDPSLARIARWRWFGGLDATTMAPLLGESESEVERRWLKARAFLAVATRPASVR